MDTQKGTGSSKGVGSSKGKKRNKSSGKDNPDAPAHAIRKKVSGIIIEKSILPLKGLEVVAGLSPASLRQQTPILVFSCQQKPSSIARDLEKGIIEDLT